jgi:maleylpyruvate isomerase
VKLYQGWRSSASWRVRWALELKQVKYDSVFLDLAAGEHHSALQGVNPMRQVPTLELDDGRVLVESVAIIEWLDETIPHRPLLPPDPWQRAQTRALVQLICAGTHPLQNSSVRLAISQDVAEQDAWCRRWIVKGLGAYEEHVRGGRTRYSLGDEITMAELYLVPQVRNAHRYDADLSGCPRVCEIYEACMATPEAARTQPSPALVP